MTKFKILSFILLGQMSFSCKKENVIKPVAMTSVIVVNSMVGSQPIIPIWGGGVPVWFSNAKKISYNGYYEYPLISTNTPVSVYQSTDTVNAVYNSNTHGGGLDLKPQSMYSFFLCGQVGQPDAVFTQDNPPYHPPSDSSIGVRFINLSPGSNPVNVTLSTSTAVNEFANIAYKSLTDFKNYPSVASTTLTSYTFQIRDAATNTVLASYTMSGINNGAGGNTSGNSYRFRNFTIVLKGLRGGTGSAAQGTFLVNNY